MKLSIKYIDNNIDFDNSYINCLEIENKNYFYKIVNDINSISNGNILEDVIFSDDEYKELNLSNKIIWYLIILILILILRKSFL